MDFGKRALVTKGREAMIGSWLKKNIHAYTTKVTLQHFTAIFQKELLVSEIEMRIWLVK